MTTLRLVLGDQLTRSLAGLRDLDPARDIVLMAEVVDEATYVRHHKQKIVMVLSAMRHFAASLRAEGVRVDYVTLDDPGNRGSLGAELLRAVEVHRPQRVVLTEPGEWRLLERMRDWREELSVPVEIRDDDRFLCSRADFARWADGRQGLRMEFFYRDMRRRTGILMEEAEPAGGQWNFDHDNRKRLPAGTLPPARPTLPVDAVTVEVMNLVARRFPDHFGDIEPFAWPVTREGALQSLRFFLDTCLPRFGDYQDAMKAGEPFLFHAAIAPALNLGLLLPDEVCRAAEREGREGRAPLNAVEGFIRQVLGWREYVRGIYWLLMPDYAGSNALQATRDLPAFYWTGETDMACLSACVADTRRHAYAHHIQRLMVLGNFALLAGIEPRQIEEWFLIVFADAYEWVELPNVHGMAVFADGGALASKPYAASGAYIDRMSDYCRGCRYDVAAKAGEGACPFNVLYWDFLMRNEERLARNPRMAMPYRTLARMSPERRAGIQADAARFLASLGPEPDMARQTGVEAVPA
jgi:deoxyribodipyrimidine photolyase-related protein